MIYVKGTKKIDFRFYDGIGLYFTKDGTLDEINENLFAEHICDKFDFVLHNDTQFYHYKNFYWQSISNLGIKKILRDYFNKLTNNTWNRSYENRYFSALVREVKNSNELTSVENYISLKNCLFNLDKWKGFKHNKKFFSTTQLPIEYNINQNVNCLRFEAFLDEVFNSDKELVNIVQEILGYCLCSNTKAQRLFIFNGSGSNGKSILCEVITHLLGFENVSNISLKGLSNNSFELANIVDKKANISTENEFGNSHMQTNIIKSISTGDQIQINPKNKEPFSYKSYSKLVFAVNSLPQTLDTSTGFMRRLLIIPFTKEFCDNPQNSKQAKKDPHLLEKLLEELDGIFVFALEGLKRLKENNYIFTSSKAVKESLNEYKATINPYYDFIKTQLDIGVQNRELRTTVYEAFKIWATSENYKQQATVSSREFYARLNLELEALDIVCSPKKSNGNWYFKGFKLR